MNNEEQDRDKMVIAVVGIVMVFLFMDYILG